MNKEILNEQLSSLGARNYGLEILVPGSLPTKETADNLIKLLEAMYVRHGITQDQEKVENDIQWGDLLTWFAKKDSKFIATASLIKQQDGSWELGRAVSLDRGNGIGKRVILEALKFHLEKHPGIALTAEVRAAVDFEGIPGGQATQKIFFSTVNSILPITPFAVAPLFAHGDPLRNEPFILSATDVKPGKTISEKVAEIINGRNTEGFVTRLSLVHNHPFRLVIPDNNGASADFALNDAWHSPECTLIPVEATDRNMPLIGRLLENTDIVFCGVDRATGREGKPVILAATLGFIGDEDSKASVLLAPATVSDTLPLNFRLDLQKIADKFTLNRIRNIEQAKEVIARSKGIKDWGY